MSVHERALRPDDRHAAVSRAGQLGPPGSPRAVLVVDVHATGMIGVIRSLGRAGYRVHAVSADPNALGFWSRYAHVRDRHPPYDDPAFLPWLDDYVATHGIVAVVPSEGLLHALGPAYDRYAPLIPDAVPYPVVQRCLSKVLTEGWLRAGDMAARAHLPPGGIIDSVDALPDRATLAAVAPPFYLKGDAGLARTGGEAVVRRCADAETLLREARALLPRYRALLWQGHVTGRKVGVSLWRHRGEIVAENMTLGVHMQPHTGGMMSLRRTFWHPALLEDARRKLAALGWQGVAMMEYVWNPDTDEFWLIEMNARYWGYLHLDLYAGKDFPALQLAGFFGEVRRDLGPPARAASCRHTVPGEINYLVSWLRD
ncbi:MAG TPA: hypothetical protein VNN07_00015, partial [Candidatus Tectomicrobia bacterium]|nr:hypothetical protein [Candidatus Tectomicrobia bacterium]